MMDQQASSFNSEAEDAEIVNNAVLRDVEGFGAAAPSSRDDPFASAEKKKKKKKKGGKK